jgi:hypothetical protein
MSFECRDEALGGGVVQQIPVAPIDCTILLFSHSWANSVEVY